jgi:hypothetical protein
MTRFLAVDHHRRFLVLIESLYFRSPGKRPFTDHRRLGSSFAAQLSGLCEVSAVPVFGFSPKYFAKKKQPGTTNVPGSRVWWCDVKADFTAGIAVTNLTTG